MSFYEVIRRFMYGVLLALLAIQVAQHIPLPVRADNMPPAPKTPTPFYALGMEQDAWIDSALKHAQVFDVWLAECHVNQPEKWRKLHCHERVQILEQISVGQHQAAEELSQRWGGYLPQIVDHVVPPPKIYSNRIVNTLPWEEKQNSLKYSERVGEGRRVSRVDGDLPQF